MRETFQRELENVDRQTALMASLVGESFGLALRSLKDGDSTLSSDVISKDDRIDLLYRDISEIVLKLIAVGQPVAGDLRLLITIPQVIRELERTGDLAVNVAKIISQGDPPSPQLFPTLLQIGHLADRLLKEACDAYLKKDASKAAVLELKDEEIDRLYSQLLAMAFTLENTRPVRAIVNSVLLARFFERVADHAVNIGESVRYLVTAES